MADTRVQVEVEVWIRENWLPQIFGQKFRQKQLELTSGGKFVFDGVSGDERVVATVSTSGALTALGKRGSGKLQKIRADALFLLLSGAPEAVLVFSEQDMYDLCRKEAEHGRLPRSLRFELAEIPAELRTRLQEARARSS